jgi:hypothetical protein
VNEYSFILSQIVLLPLGVGNKNYFNDPTVLLEFAVFSIISLPWQGMGPALLPMLTAVLLPSLPGSS